MESRPTCVLQLSNGKRFTGELIGAPFFSSGELVFTTGMVGYSEALTDPSYYGQILTFTYPLIGNYGIPEVPSTFSLKSSNGFESSKVHAAAVILSVDSEDAFHWTSRQTLDEWLKTQGIPGIVGLDTRQLVHMIREHQGLFAQIHPIIKDTRKGYTEFFSREDPNFYFDPSGNEVVKAVSCKEPHVIGKGKKRVVVVDTGVKWNILRQLLLQDIELMIVPWNFDLSKADGDGILLSNGPGDPQRTGDLKHQIRSLLNNKRPILGICLGHQLLALAAGATTSKMPYGHRSHNQPVQLVGTRRGFITSQNHGFKVDEASLPQDWEPWFINANDQTIEGIKHKSRPFRSVQFHPEAAGGPRDTSWIIEEFVKEL